MKARSILNEVSLLIIWLLVAAIVYASVTGWLAGNGMGGGWNWIKTKFSVAGPTTPDLGAATAAAAGGITSAAGGLSGIGSGAAIGGISGATGTIPHGVK